MLKTARIALAPFSMNDLPILFPWINDRQLVLLNSPYKPIHLESHRAWYESVQQRNDMVIFAIREFDSTNNPNNDTNTCFQGRMIGYCQLHSIHTVHRTAELQIRIGASEAHGKGYGTEAAQLILDFAFNDLNLNRVFLHVFKSNERAIRLYKKLGFSLEGTLRQGAYVDGKYIDVLVMGVLKEEYGPAANQKPSRSGI